MKLKNTEKILLFYIFITTFLMIFTFQKNFIPPLITNIVLLLIIFAISIYDKTGKGFFRTIYPLFMLGHFYSETYLLNHTFFKNNLDAFFMKIDKFIFGFQPALLFSEKFSSPFFNNIFYFAYLSFLFLPITTSLLIYFFKREYFEKAVFIIVTSFIIYYLIFITIPVVGPQFYWSKSMANMPALGIFGKIVKFIQKHAEYPTGAFPSSHVGMSIIITLIIYKSLKKIFPFFLPLIFLIILSTVYIKAHYAIDVIAGIITAFLIWELVNKVWHTLNYISIKSSIILPIRLKIKKLLLMFVAKQ